jgi:hypothetical protein
MMENGDKESCGFPCAGLRLHQHIFPQVFVVESLPEQETFLKPCFFYRF